MQVVGPSLQQRAPFLSEAGPVVRAAHPVPFVVGQARFNHIGPARSGLVGPSAERCPAEPVNGGSVTQAQPPEGGQHRHVRQGSLRVQRRREDHVRPDLQRLLGAQQVHRLLRQVDNVFFVGLHAPTRNDPGCGVEVEFVPGGTEYLRRARRGQQRQFKCPRRSARGGCQVPAPILAETPDWARSPGLSPTNSRVGRGCWRRRQEQRRTPGRNRMAPRDSLNAWRRSPADT